MGYIRLLHPKNYEKHRGRFSDVCFRKSKDGGLSVFDPDCAIATSGLIEAHVKRFYPQLAGHPPIYIAFEDADLPQGAVVTATPSDSGDLCHREIDGVSNNALKKALMALPEDRYKICDPAGDKTVGEAEHKTLMQDA